MKENIILFIIIVFFIFTVVFFKNKEGIDSTLTSSRNTLPGDTCSNNTNTDTTNCDWNNDKNDISDWWNEHKTSEDTLINSVKWNHHTIDLGDFTKYKYCYRSPTDKTNGIADDAFITGYLKDRENESKEFKTSNSNYTEMISNYDISFSKYKSMLENYANTITSINAEKERYKRDISNSVTKDNYDNYEYYYEEKGPDGSTCPSLKCIADFGTNIGENLCCGQTGVLQNTEYVCPSVKPTCQNFKCGSKFGTCV
jgi:hypothetical protein